MSSVEAQITAAKNLQNWKVGQSEQEKESPLLLKNDGSLFQTRVITLPQTTEDAEQTAAQVTILLKSTNHIKPNKESPIFGMVELLQYATQTHPNIKSARYGAIAAQDDLAATERQRWPTMSAVLENKSTNLNVSYTRLVRVEQNIWDAGKANALVAEAEAKISLTEANVYIQNQVISFQVVAAWQMLTNALGRIEVAREAIYQLAKFKQQMQRRVEAEVSPPIDFELVQSKLLQTEVELVQAENSRQIAISRLEQYSGINDLGRNFRDALAFPDLILTDAFENELSEMDLSELARRHPDVLKARLDARVANQQIKVKQAEQWPQLYVRVDRPIDSADNNFAGFFGLRYSPGAGFATGIEAQALAARAQGQVEAVDGAVRTVLETLYSDRDEFLTTKKRIKSIAKSVDGAEMVLRSYERQFIAGRKSWQDLMNAVREYAQTKYSLVDAQSAMFAALYRFQIRIGSLPYPVK